jgi:L-ascorbate 6-phosphate lactonase
MAKVNEITRESWVLSTFPEWGTWLNEEIDQEVVEPGKFAMWWLGCTGVWIQTENSTNIVVDAWFGNGKRTKKVQEMAPFHQMRNMTGGKMLQPNLRGVQFVYDPFAVTTVDAVLSTHYHADHIDINFAAAVLQNVKKDVPFIGPLKSVELWLKWGVPAERCQVVKPGDVIKINDVEIVVLDSFDRTCLVTTDHDVRGICPTDMDDKAVNYLIKTPGGNIYHSGDSHYSIYFAKHGKDHHIDLAFGSYGENPVGNQDKMTSIDILRMAEALNTKVVIPLHYDIWTNFKADPKEILMLFDYKKDVLQYKFEPFIWDVGGKFIYPDDASKRQFHFRRGFEDCFEDEPNVPFRSIL